ETEVVGRPAQDAFDKLAGIHDVANLPDGELGNAPGSRQQDVRIDRRVGNLRAPVGQIALDGFQQGKPDPGQVVDKVNGDQLQRVVAQLDRSGGAFQRRCAF